MGLSTVNLPRAVTAVTACVVTYKRSAVCQHSDIIIHHSSLIMRLVVISILLSIAVHSATSLQCFSCTQDCDDVTNHKQETCDDSEEFCLRLKDGGELTLACSPDPPREGAGCRENGDNIQCFCSSNLCNSASGMGLTGFLLISLIALVVGSH